MNARIWICLSIGFSLSAAEEQPNWLPLDVREYRPIFNLHVHGDTVWAASNGGVYHSFDEGAHWSPPTAGFGNDRVSEMAFIGDRIVAAEFRSLWVSEDRGRTWIARDSVFAGTFFRFIARGDTLYAYHSLLSGPPADGAHFSVDQGRTWKESPFTVPAESPADTQAIYRGAAFSFRGRTLYRDSGSVRDSILAMPDEIAQVAASSGWLFLRTADGRCQRSADGRGGWSSVKIGYGPAKARAIIEDSLYMAMATDKALYLSRNRGVDWEHVRWNTQTGTYAKRLFLSGGRLFEWAPKQTRVARFDIGTGIWDSLDLPSANIWSGFSAADGAMAYTLNGPTVGVNLSTDFGAHFTLVPAFFPWINPPLLAISGNRIFAVNEQGPAIYRDNALTWRSLPSLVKGGMTQPYSLALTAGGIFAADPRGLILTYSGADSAWRKVTAPAGGGTQSSLLSGYRDRLFMVDYMGGKAWVWEQSPSTALARGGAKSGAAALRQGAARYPVRIWNLPSGPAGGAGIWIDAKGARRTAAPGHTTIY